MNSSNQHLEHSIVLEDTCTAHDIDIPKIDSAVEVSEESNMWGLLRRVGSDQECKLMHRIKNNSKDCYTIGRHKECDVVISDRRVSSIHCIISCEYSNDSNERLTMFVTDSSANGTYVNNALIRLSNGQRTELKSGDEIYLMNPRYVTPENGLVSFIFINMRDRLVAQKKVDTAPSPYSRITHEAQRRIEDLYVIGDAIGSGMCGQVHICTHKATMKQYAVKVIDTKKFAKTPGLSTSELRQEAEMMRILNHPNIIRIEDTFETAHRIFIVMELVTGGDLFDRIIEKGKYSESSARNVMRMLLEAVKYLHSNNIVHRDLKPENILLVDSSPNAQIKITDFGLAKRASHEGLKTFCGTPQYFAPEVLGRRSETPEPSTEAGRLGARYGYKADMWSLGVVLFIMLSGVFPFDEDQLYDQLREARYSLSGREWSAISNSAKGFVRSLMTLNPVDRLDVHQALQHPWMNPNESPCTSESKTERNGLRNGGDIPRGVGQQESLNNSAQICSNYNPTNSNQKSLMAPDQSSQEKKTFSPVFWSIRRAISATVAGGIPQANGPDSRVPSGNTNGLPSSTSISAGDGTINGWCQPVVCCDGNDDIDEFSSEDDTCTRPSQVSTRGRKRGRGEGRSRKVPSATRKEPKIAKTCTPQKRKQEESISHSTDSASEKMAENSKALAGIISKKEFASTKKNKCSEQPSSKTAVGRMPMKTLQELFTNVSSKKLHGSNNSKS